MIDESQVAINLYKEHFSTTQTCGQLRPFFTILLRTAIHLQCPYGFAQLCIFKRLADLNTFEMDAITVRIVEPIPILTFKEYLKSFLFEPCLTIPLVELFNAKSSTLMIATRPYLARLVKDSSGVTAKRTTDPHHFYSLGDKQTNLKKEVKRRIFPTETNAESKYTIYNKSRPKRTVAANFNDIEVSGIISGGVSENLKGLN
ncbi:hypothetical protein RIR_jg1746.t1 [Rhizophagus irregularis DAOM 181602=DAOM 197198]|nr:hypothetical protein RIR_jg1746.t1 [Rhizophagus irregularis DAOM 181602=DAOM 197198]